MALGQELGLVLLTFAHAAVIKLPSEHRRVLLPPLVLLGG